jgi:hypothetical protein
MALTKDDLQALSDTVRPIVKEEVNVLRVEMEKRFEQVDKRFDQVDQRLNGIDHRLEGIDKVLNDLVQAVTVESTENYADHEERLKTLEQGQSSTS